MQSVINPGYQTHSKSIINVYTLDQLRRHFNLDIHCYETGTFYEKLIISYYRK